MQKTRTHLAIIAMVASMGLLAACSKGEDTKPAASSAPGSEAPATTPAPVTPAPQAPAPDATPSTTPPTPAPSSGSMDKAKESVKDAASSVADKAGQLKDSAAEKAGQMGDAIKKGAADANQAIQDKVGNGATPPAPTPSK